MDLSLLTRESEFTWRIEPRGPMRVPGVIYADEALIRAMDKVAQSCDASPEVEMIEREACGDGRIGYLELVGDWPSLPDRNGMVEQAIGATPHGLRRALIENGCHHVGHNVVLDLAALGLATGSDVVELAQESEFATLFPDCEAGACYDSYNATAYWCTETQKPLGPDGRPVHEDTCRHGRECCKHG